MRTKRLPALFALIFFLSGAGSLMYEVVWQRLLTVHYGVGAVATTLIVSVYMGGLGLGALLGGHFAERLRQPLTLYVAVEFGLGCVGLVSLSWLDFLGRHTAGSDYPVSLACMALFLSLPTLVMGMTLPLLTKIYNRLVKNFVYTVAWLYFVNTLGAACGALFASYVAITFFGLDIAVFISAGTNFVLAGGLWVVRGYWSKEVDGGAGPRVGLAAPNVAAAQPAGGTHTDDVSLRPFQPVYLLAIVTGFLAIGYEIAWFRALHVLLKSSPYVFATVLSIYLIGIALGSYGILRFVERRPHVDRRRLFFTVQFWIAILVSVIVLGYHYGTAHTGFAELTRLSFSTELHPALLPLGSSSRLDSWSTLFPLVDIVFWPVFFVLGPCLLLGASFPLVCSLALVDPHREGRTVGHVYFFNIIGNVLGGVVTGTVLLPRIGTEWTLLAFTSAGLMFGLCLAECMGRRLSFGSRTVVVGLLLSLNLVSFPDRGELFKTMHIAPGAQFQVELEEGRDGVVVTYHDGPNVVNLINGLGHGRRPNYWYYRESLEAIAFARSVQNVLIIGFGTGSIAETVLKLDGIESVVVVEINDALLRNLQKVPVCREILADERLDWIVDDGRRFLLRTGATFDLILMDPLRTTEAYSNNLYSLEFFELAHRRLADGGVLMVWLDEHRVLPRTLATACRHVRQYNFFCLASNAPFQRHATREQQVATRCSREFLAGVESVPMVFAADERLILERTAGLPVNRDTRPVCEYYLGHRDRGGGPSH